MNNALCIQEGKAMKNIKSNVCDIFIAEKYKLSNINEKNTLVEILIIN